MSEYFIYPRILEDMWIIYETKYGLLIYCFPCSKHAFLASTYFSIRRNTRKKFQEHINNKTFIHVLYFYIQQLNTVRSPLFFREIVDALGPPPPYPWAFCTLNSFAHIRRQRWRPVDSAFAISNPMEKWGTVKSVEQYN